MITNTNCTKDFKAICNSSSLGCIVRRLKVFQGLLYFRIPNPNSYLAHLEKCFKGNKVLIQEYVDVEYIIIFFRFRKGAIHLKLQTSSNTLGMDPWWAWGHNDSYLVISISPIAWRIIFWNVNQWHKTIYGISSEVCWRHELRQRKWRWMRQLYGTSTNNNSTVQNQLALRFDIAGLLDTLVLIFLKYILRLGVNINIYYYYRLLPIVR